MPAQITWQMGHALPPSISWGSDGFTTCPYTNSLLTRAFAKAHAAVTSTARFLSLNHRYSPASSDRLQQSAVHSRCLQQAYKVVG